MVVGKSVKRVDAFDKVTGRALYTDDLADKSAYVAKILHATIAHGYVKSIDTSEAEQIDGVIRIVTCFDVPDIPFPTAGHPWSTDPHHQDVADRLLLNRHVRYYGDDIAAVIARDEVSAAKAIRAMKVEYDVLPFVLDPQESMQEGAPQLHEKYANNILAHTTFRDGNLAEAILEEGLTKIEGWYDTPTVQHCHIENFICYAKQEAGKITVVASTQIPHIVRRVTAQALGIPWGQVRIIKPYIGGGFGNKQITYDHSAAKVSTEWDTPSIWLRRHFTYSKPAGKILRANVDMFHDEDAEVYLNGKLIVKAANYNTEFTPFGVKPDVFAAAVKDGDNVIAVKVTQKTGGQYIDLGISLDVAK